MKRFVRLILGVAAAFLILSSGSAYALDTVKACVKYQRADYSWTHGYKIEGIYVNGADLNNFTNTYKYDSWATYFVIPWKEGGYTALNMDYQSELYSYEQTFKDQRDISWQVKEGWSFCY